MRVETPRARQERRLQNAEMLSAAQARAMETQRAARAQEDGFLRLCWENYHAAMEREAKPKAAPAVTVEPVREVKKEQPANRLRKKAECFLSGMSIGAAVMLLIVWLLLLAAGVI